jgi:toxin HigB-1
VALSRTLALGRGEQAALSLASPPGNRLEALRGRLQGLYSIGINDQWRIVFRWAASGPDAVDIVDYH